jgi:hypothetical protein
MHTWQVPTAKPEDMRVPVAEPIPQNAMYGAGHQQHQIVKVTPIVKPMVYTHIIMQVIHTTT